MKADTCDEPQKTVKTRAHCGEKQGRCEIFKKNRPKKALAEGKDCKLQAEGPLSRKLTIKKYQAII